MEERSQYNNHFTEMFSGFEAGSHVRLIDSCISQLEDQDPFRTCNESEEEEEEEARVLSLTFSFFLDSQA